jgi:hypothetical protein
MAKKQNAKSNESKSQPVEEIRIGSIKAAIWRNEGEQGARYNVTFQRIYRTNEGEWRSTDSFGRDDLLILGKVADAAHTRVLQLYGEQREQQKAETSAA